MLLLAFVVSFISWFAMEFNNTNDTTYVFYFISMIVWLIGAYTLIWYLQFVHHTLSIIDIGCYLAAVGALQGIFAIWMDNNLEIVDFFIRIRMLDPEDVAYAQEGDRLFGIGCSYDPGGIRLATILVIMGYLLQGVMERFNAFGKILYIGAFICIVIFGNMISRTTSVGFIIAIVYIIIQSGLWRMSIVQKYVNTLKWLSVVFVVSTAVVIFSYQQYDRFRENFRFGFEGFVSLAETGEWNVKSNETLITMYRFPESLHTWLIGDGYIDSTDNNPYYIGERYKGYYMSTDVGYLRFVYYGGLFMLLSFLSFIGWSAHTCGDFFPRYKVMFWLMFLVQIGVWFKVATDIFCMFAIFIAMGMIYMSNNQFNRVSRLNAQNNIIKDNAIERNQFVVICK